MTTREHRQVRWLGHTFDAAGDELVASFREHGFVVLDAALSAEEVATVNAEAVRLCRGDLGLDGAQCTGERSGGSTDLAALIGRRRAAPVPVHPPAAQDLPGDRRLAGHAADSWTS